jgi:excisionase family DNA binding protein
MERLMTVEQVAERLQVNEQTIRRWLRDGEMTGVPFGGRTGWRVSEEDLRAFLDRRRAAGDQEAPTKKLAG